MSGDDATQSPGSAAPPQYNLRNVLSTAREVDAGDLGRAATNVWASPCFRQGVLWGAGVGALFALHRLKQGGSGTRAFNDAVLSSLLTYGSQWYLCRRDESDRRAALRAYYEGSTRDGSAPEAAVRRGGVSGSDARIGGDDDEAWRRELERVVAYDLPHVEHGDSAGVKIR